MKKPLVLTAFGTTSQALASYTIIENYLKKKLDDVEIHWAFSSRMVANQLRKEQGLEIESLESILAKLFQQGHRHAQVQSLHLFPGYEFHKICGEARRAEISTSVGGPLLSSPEDYTEVCEIVAPLLDKHPYDAILIMGHGTDHPIWTAYPALEKHLRQRFGDRIFVGVVEKFPDCSSLPEEIAQQGYKRVFMIPFFLVAGLHYHRDMMGEENSWRQKLQALGIEVDSHDTGLAELAGTERLILRHIQYMESGK